MTLNDFDFALIWKDRERNQNLGLLSTQRDFVHDIETDTVSGIQKIPHRWLVPMYPCAALSLNLRGFLEAGSKMKQTQSVNSVTELLLSCQGAAIPSSLVADVIGLAGSCSQNNTCKVGGIDMLTTYCSCAARTKDPSWDPMILWVYEWGKRKLSTNGCTRCRQIAASSY